MGADVVMPFLQGLLAGYGIAIPVGAIAILIIGTGIQQGFRNGFLAGAGAATADFLFALIAVIAGQSLVQALQPITLPLRIASGFILVGLGVYGLSRLKSSTLSTRKVPTRGQNRSNPYIQFLGLTLLNPLTITYFGALILGGGASQLNTLLDRALFVVGAGLASLSWQTLLAAFGAFTGRRLSPRGYRVTILVGNLIVIGFGANILITTLW